jgi:hypothetical protein
MKRANPMGYGSPYIKVRGCLNEPLTYNIDSFVFKYCEDDDDTCTIVFKTDDVYIRDNVSFQQDVAWKIQWGYLPSPEFPEGYNSRIRKMAVRDIDTTYDRNGVVSRVTLSNFASYLRQYDPRGAGSSMQGVSLAEVVNNFASTLGLTVKFESGTNGVEIDGNGDMSIVASGENNSIANIKYAYFLNQLEQAKNPENINKSSSLEWQQKKWDPKNLPKNFTLHEDMFHSNSAWQTIKRLIREEKTPGLKIVGRDDLLLITKRTLSKTPIHTYTYQGDKDGELLSFDSSKKRYKKSKAFDHRLGAWNTVIKEKTVQFVSKEDLPNTNKLRNMVKDDRNHIISPEQYTMLKEAIKNIDEGKGGKIPISPEQLKLISHDVNTGIGYNNGELTGVQFDLILNPVDFEGIPIQTTTTKKVFKTGGIFSGGKWVDEVTVIDDWNKNFSGYWRAFISIKGGKQQSRTNIMTDRQLGPTVNGLSRSDPADGSQWPKENLDFINTQNVTTPTDASSTESQRAIILPIKRFYDVGTNEGTAVNEILNDLEQTENDTNPATFKAVGQPLMEAQEVLEFKNLAIRDSGRYWIKDLTHTITKQGGYIMDGELVRNMLNSTYNDIGTKEVPNTAEEQPEENRTYVPNDVSTEDSAASYLTTERE